MQNINNEQDVQDKATEIEGSNINVCKDISRDVKDKFKKTLNAVLKESSDIMSDIITLESEIDGLTSGKLKRGVYECMTLNNLNLFFLSYSKKFAVSFYFLFQQMAVTVGRRRSRTQWTLSNTPWSGGTRMGIKAV